MPFGGFQKVLALHWKVLLWDRVPSGQTCVGLCPLFLHVTLQLFPSYNWAFFSLYLKSIFCHTYEILTPFLTTFTSLTVKLRTKFWQNCKIQVWNVSRIHFNPAIRFRDIFGHPRINFLSNMGIISFSHIGWHFSQILWWWWVWRVMNIFSSAIARKPHAAGAQMGK